MTIFGRVTNWLSAFVLGALALQFYLGLRYGEPPWMQEIELVQLGVMLAVSFGIGLVLVQSSVCQAVNFPVRILRVGVIATIVCFPVLLLLVLLDLDYRRVTLLVELALVYVLLYVFGIGLPRWVSYGLGSAVLAVGISTSFSEAALNGLADLLDGESGSSIQSNYTFTSLHDLEIVESTFNSDPHAKIVDNRGAIELIDGNQLLMIGGDDRFHVLTVQDDGTVTSKALVAANTLINRSAYSQDVQSPSSFFRITDLLLVGESRKRKLYLAHHQWNEEKQCVTLNIDETEIDVEELDRQLHWKTIFQSFPCIPGKWGLTIETGGRLALRSPDSLLLSVGVTVDAYDSTPVSDASYGKIVEINLLDGNSRIFSSGHRNPQGLLVDGVDIWETEHGPNGGDELNKLSDGQNYGWPFSSYGVDYGKKALEGSQSPGEHIEGVRPLYAWVPSIGVSRLIRVKGAAFSAWKGDLLVAAMSGRGRGFAVYRIRIRDGAVKVVERIETGIRVRDLVEMPDGRIVLWEGYNTVQTLKPAAHVFSACVGCHAINRDWPNNGIGPDLWGIVGKPVANVKGFTYSESMENLGGRWSRTRLDWFLRDPQEAVPGTAMKIQGIADKETRTAIIEYLKSSASL